MKPSLLRVGVLFFSYLLLPFAHATDDIRIDYREGLQQLEISRVASSAAFKSDDVTMQRKHTQARPIEAMRFNAFSRQYTLRLAPNHSVLNAAAHADLAADIEIYRGDIDSAPGSWVRLVFVAGVPRGLFWDGEAMFAIETDDDAPNTPYVFQLDDLKIAPGTFSCASSGSHDPKTAGELFRAVAKDIKEHVARGPGANSNLDISIIADAVFTNANNNTEAEMITRINNVDGIFSSQLGVQLTVSQTDVFTSADDPFTDETESGDLLDEVGDFRFAIPSNQRGGLTHLFTGKNVVSTDPSTGDVQTSTVGIAYTNALCSRRFGVGLTEARFSATADSLIAAHEIGHNFGAPHDGTDGSACESETGDFIMAPRLNGSDQFSSCSIQQMAARAAVASCVSALATEDVAVSGSTPGDILLGNNTTITFEVSSTGTGDATNVSLEVSIPAGVTLDNVSTSIGNCSSGSGTASCSIGTVSAGSGATVNITVTPTASGDKSFSATVTAASDQNANNNQSTLNLTVDPVIDLVVTTSSAQVLIDTTASTNITIENRGPSAASAASVTITPDAGLNIESASWADGSCSVAGNVATCDASSSLASNSSSAISAVFTGTTLGEQTFAVAASASEVDTDTSNNSETGRITVNSAATTPSGDDSSGGGGFGWLVVLVLSGLALRRPTA